jgi:restriction endonuclease S subunit
LLWLRNFKNVEASFIQLILDITVANNLNLLTNGAAYNALTIIKLKDLKIPLPHLKIQEQIVEKIEAERALVESAKELIEIYKQKIKSKISEVWGE